MLGRPASLRFSRIVERPLLKGEGKRSAPAMQNGLMLPTPNINLSGAKSHCEPGSCQKSKILVIDDEPANVALLEAVLHEYGYENVKGITDSRLAFEVYRTFQPDLILLDLMMPYVDGFAILQTLSSQPSEASTPVVVLTADENVETRVRALNAGATDFMLKPFVVSETLARIERLLALDLHVVSDAVRGEVNPS